MEKSFSERVVEAKAAVPAVSAGRARDLWGGGGVVFVDPRPAAAIASTTGIIPGALNIPLDAIERGELPGELEASVTRVVTACQGGPMGAIAAHELAKHGFADVSYVDGGTQAWLDAGYETRPSAEVA